MIINFIAPNYPMAGYLPVLTCMLSICTIHALMSHVLLVHVYSESSLQQVIACMGIIILFMTVVH